MIKIGDIVSTILRLKDGKDIEIRGEVMSDQGNMYKIRIINPIECKDREIYLLKSRQFKIGI